MNILNDDCTLYKLIPIPIFIITPKITVHGCNPAALELLGLDSTHDIVNRHSGDVLSCINAVNFSGTCGCTDQCVKCDIRNSLTETFNTDESIIQKSTTIQVYRNGISRNVNALITTFKLSGDNAVLVIENITDIVNLQQLIPICSYCKKVRSDDKYWASVEEYIEVHSGCDVTSGICPHCIAKLYPDLTTEQLELLKGKY